MFDRLRGTRRHVAVAAIAGCLLLSATAAPYYFWKIGRVESQTQPPEFLSTGDDKAIAWLAGQPGSDTVLAPSDVSPWVAAWAAKRVVVGHFLWTHDFKANRQAVDAVYGGANPAPLIKKLGIRWIIVHTDARPRWAQGVAPVATFPGSAVLDASTILAG
jgi:hypothetical protein